MIAQRARQASLTTSALTHEQRISALLILSKLLEVHTDFLVQENKKDLRAFEKGMGKKASQNALYQRLSLTPEKLLELRDGIEQIAGFRDPIGKLQIATELDDGLILERRSVPLGVLAIVFESRPDAVPQILSLLLKTGNSAILKGGKEALRSFKAFEKILKELQVKCPFLPKNWCQLLYDRNAFTKLLKDTQNIDLVIPRGSSQLVRTIQNSTRIPVLGHAEGICHIYVDAEADLEKALPIVLDAKTQYPAACNSVETLLLHKNGAQEFLQKFKEHPLFSSLTLKGCKETVKLLHRLQAKIKRATTKDYRTEWGNLTMNIRIVQNIEEAIYHIQTYGSHHTDAILSEDPEMNSLFLRSVDSANVFSNCSTRFADGFRYGFGAEIGVSTARTHARGPVGLEGLTIYKYLLRGSGQTVSDYSNKGSKKFSHKPLGTNRDS